MTELAQPRYPELAPMAAFDYGKTCQSVMKAKIRHGGNFVTIVDGDGMAICTRHDLVADAAALAAERLVAGGHPAVDSTYNPLPVSHGLSLAVCEGALAALKNPDGKFGECEQFHALDPLRFYAKAIELSEEDENGMRVGKIVMHLNGMFVRCWLRIPGRYYAAEDDGEKLQMLFPVLRRGDGSWVIAPVCLDATTQIALHLCRGSLSELLGEIPERGAPAFRNPQLV